MTALGPGTEIVVGQEPEIAPGVRGYMIEHNGALYIPLVIASVPGSGAVGRFLDALPTDRDVKFPCVISWRLRKMLRRRGFRRGYEYDEFSGEAVEVWFRP